MPYIQVPDTSFDLFYRLSTPLRSNQATSIEEEYETILLFHPYWVDSFYFYPQFDDPSFNENYNIIAFDAPAHGSTKAKGISSEPVTWSYFASIVKDALTILKIPAVHVIGSTMGCCAAMHFASKYPEITKTLTMSAPPALEEATNWSLTFRECMHILINSVKTNDPEPLDAITSVIFDYNATSHSSQVLKDLEEEYCQSIRSRLLRGELNGEMTVPILISLALSRKHLLSLDEMVNLKPPVLIIQGTNEGWEASDDQWAKILEESDQIHRQKYGKGLNIKRMVLDDLPRWMSLTCPETVNPIIKGFVRTGSSGDVSSLAEFEVDQSTSTDTTMRMISTTRRRLSINPPKPRLPFSRTDPIDVGPVRQETVGSDKPDLMANKRFYSGSRHVNIPSNTRSGKNRSSSIDINVHVDVVTKVD
ncbi:uncharacterized protein I206_102376 [Kwoniella pini CBS 10737]|uniref:AB hydrolase-1 domain-containing protein n=1 Tax=Kwoniella pini CBS 10737 TaxID=1296096 RepID=A0A1B9I569_9TREE|nr:uncharacterized protein I206_02723 [Kwoniella pini CBS 10737]OCF50668.1 hypothetical protein I206_02723 [Kwoniella pini CBS 10737]